MMGAKLIAPVIEVTFDEGFDWLVLMESFPLHNLIYFPKLNAVVLWMRVTPE